MTTGNRQPATHIIAALAAMMCLNCTTDATRRGYLRTIAETYGPPPRPVIIVPGFGVTRLYDPVTRQYVWGTPRSTVHRNYPDDLDLPESGHDRLVPRGYVGSRGPVNIGWQLMEGLRKFGRYTPDKDVIPFYYDWRLSARDNAQKLDEVIERVRGGGRVDVVAHSAGAIVALTYVKLGGGESKVDHLVLIAPTRRGVVDAFRVLVRPERFLRRVFTANMVATWPFVFELLPEDGRFLVDQEGHSIDRDLWTSEGWRGIQRVPAHQLSDARKLRDELRRTSMPAQVHVSVIAGDCVATARRVLMRRDGRFVFYPSELTPHERGLEKTLFEPGDGTVPIDSATDGENAMMVCDGHQGIAADPTVHRAIIRTLREQPPP
jgi:pimeloyl-ACP methyl ester carboxylesterase